MATARRPLAVVGLSKLQRGKSQADDMEQGSVFGSRSAASIDNDGSATEGKGTDSHSPDSNKMRASEERTPRVRPPSLLTIKTFHFTLGVMGCAWGRFQSIFLHSMGLRPSTIGFLASIGFIAKSVGYTTWGIVMDWYHGSRLVLMSSILLAMISLEMFRRAVVSQIFVLMVLTKALRSFSNAQYCLLDALTVVAVKADGSEDYGRQRFWASLGFGAASFAVGSLIDNSELGTDMIFVHTYAMSIFFAALVGLSQISAASTGNSRRGYAVVKIDGPVDIKKVGDSGQAAENPDNDVQNIACKRKSRFNEMLARLRSFFQSRLLTILFINGLCFNILLCTFESIIWIHAERLSCPRSLVGLATTVQTLVEFPLFYYSKKIMARFTHRQLFLGAHGALCLRMCLLIMFGAYGNVYLILPIQVMHGFTFGVNWLASTEYIHRLAESDITACAQSTLSTTVVFANAFGTYLWGVLYERYGTSTFSISAICSGCAFLTFTFLVKSLGKVLEDDKADNQNRIDVYQDKIDMCNLETKMIEMNAIDHSRNESETNKDTHSRSIAQSGTVNINDSNIGRNKGMVNRSATKAQKRLN